MTPERIAEIEDMRFSVLTQIVIDEFWADREGFVIENAELKVYVDGLEKKRLEDAATIGMHNGSRVGWKARAETAEAENAALVEKVEGHQLEWQAATNVLDTYKNRSQTMLLHDHVLAVIGQMEKRFAAATTRAETAEADLAERTCEWEEYKGVWLPGCCGETWEFTDGGPRENAVTHCMFCGGPMILATGKDGG